MDSNAIFAILLLIVGIGILCAEVFIPSGGLLGVITFLTLVVSIVFAYRAWGTTNSNVFWLFCAVLLLMIPVGLGSAFYILPRTAAGRRVLLEAPPLEKLAPFSSETARLEKLVGRTGKAVTMLNPGGLVLIDGERLHAFSEGVMIDAQQPVLVLEARGTRLLVRESDPVVDKPPASADPFPSQPSADRPVDFEIPHG